MRHPSLIILISAFFGLLLFSCESKRTYQVVAEIYPPSSSHFIENEPLFIKNSGLDKILVSAVKSGALPAYFLEGDKKLKPLSVEDFKKRLKLNPDEVEDAWGHPGLEYQRLGIGVLYEMKLQGHNKGEDRIKLIKLFITHDHSPDGQPKTVALLKYEDCAKLLSAPGIPLWVDPYDNENSKSFAQILENKIFKAYSIEIFEEGKSIYYNDQHYVKSAEKYPDNKDIKVLSHFENDIRSLYRPGYMNQQPISAGVLQFKVIEGLVADEGGNIELFTEGKEISRIIIDAVLAGNLKPYSNDSLSQAISMEIFSRNLYADIYSDDEQISTGRKHHIGCFNLLQVNKQMRFQKRTLKDSRPISVALVLNGNCLPTKIHKPIAHFEFGELKKILKEDPRSSMKSEGVSDYGDFLEMDKFQIERYNYEGKDVFNIQVYNVYGYKIYDNGFYFSKQDSLMYSQVLQKLIK
jgi:hypothetical protein